MTTALDVDGRVFVFPSGWSASKYDEWSYYRKRFISTGAKAVDVVAVDGTATLHLIEVKDYTHPATDSVPSSSLPATVAEKCRDTLGGLLAGRWRAEGAELQMCRTAVQAREVRVVLHIELPARGGRLADPRRLLLDLRTKLRAAAKSIDPHAQVEDHSGTSVGWSTHLAP